MKIEKEENNNYHCFELMELPLTCSTSLIQIEITIMIGVLVINDFEVQFIFQVSTELLYNSMRMAEGENIPMELTALPFEFYRSHFPESLTV